MKKLLIALIAIFCFTVGNIAVVVVLPAICSILGYHPEPDHALLWGGRPELVVGVGFVGFLAVCFGTFRITRVLQRKLLNQKRQEPFPK
jgi:hypothetical protein